MPLSRWQILYDVYVYDRFALYVPCFESFILCWARCSSLIGKEVENKVSILEALFRSSLCYYWRNVQGFLFSSFFKSSVAKPSLLGSALQHCPCVQLSQQHFLFELQSHISAPTTRSLTQSLCIMLRKTDTICFSTYSFLSLLLQQNC